MNDLRIRYLRRLEPWLQAAVRDLYVPPARPDLQCYGSGYNGWGVQTNQKAFAAFAVLGADPELDPGRAGMEREEIIDRALRMLRFSLASHVEGDYQCLDGTSWGHTWISSLGIERMMHAVDALWSFMDQQDRLDLRRVLLSECDWLVDGYHRGDPARPGQVRAGLVEENHPENNLWNGVVLHRTAMMYPDAPRVEDYRRRGTRFILNGISTPEDAAGDTVFAGAPLSDWHVGANFFPSYALNHHRYLNVGYMVICLSQVALAHFAWKHRNLVPPPELYHHVEDLWRVVKKMTFPDGRLARIGGDTRARYCYCQDYAIPVWLLMSDRFGDRDGPVFEDRWLAVLEREVAAGSGSGFLDARLRTLRELSPTYYTRLESDRAAALSMALCWRRRFDEVKSLPPACQESSTGGWEDEYHGASMVRGSRRLASWTWRAAQGPQGLCVPVERSDMAEWQFNLSARILGLGARNVTEVKQQSRQMPAGGFINSGCCDLRSEQNLAEGEADKVIARQHIVCAALPDDATVVVFQFVRAVGRTFVRSVKGLHLMMPNDLFNDGIRSYRHSRGTIRLAGPAGRRELLELPSPWVNIDGCLTVTDLDGGCLQIFRPEQRQVEIRDKPFSVSSLYADEICTVCQTGIRSFHPDEVIVDTAFALRVEPEGGAGRDSGPVPGRVLRQPGFRAAVVEAADAQRYLLVFNIGRDAGDFVPPVMSSGRFYDPAADEEIMTAVGAAPVIHLEAAAARLLRLPAPRQ